MNLVVTGATGYIGCHVVSLAKRKGHHVVVASRSCPESSVLSCLPFDLTATTPLKLTPDTNVIIHLAANTSSTEAELVESELISAKLLIAASKVVSAKFIFVSSQTARQDAPTAYGRTKWHIEQEVLNVGGWVVRPGQVYGGSERGLFGTLVNVTESSPILPAFLPAPKIQPIHVDDLAEGILRIAERDDVESGVLCIGSSDPISFNNFLAHIACHRVRRLRLFVPIPIILIKFIGALLGSHLRVRFGISRLYSLFDLPLMDTRNILNQLGLSLRTLSNGMYSFSNNNRSQLLREGHIFFNYLFKKTPSSSLLRRYVRAIEKIRGGQPLNLPIGVYNFPILITLLDKQSHLLKEQSNEFTWRLNAALVLAEATPQGAKSFLGIGGNAGIFISIFGILKALSSELIMGILFFVSKPVFRNWLNKG